MERRLYRTRDDRMIWGVCGGLARYFDVDPAIVRVVMVLLIFANGLGLLVYLILAIVTPLEPQAPESRDPSAENEEVPKEAGPENTEHRAPSSATQQEYPPAPGDETAREPEGSYFRRRLFIGIVLIVIGAFLLIGTLGFFDWFDWRLWPLIIVFIGLLIITASRR
jgi:phage shock protein C